MLIEESASLLSARMPILYLILRQVYHTRPCDAAAPVPQKHIQLLFVAEVMKQQGFADSRRRRNFAHRAVFVGVLRRPLRKLFVIFSGACLELFDCLLPS